MPPFLHSVFAGQPKVLLDDRGPWTSSIARERVEGPIKLCSRGLAGDGVAQPYQGSPGAAVCVHLCDHYEFWRTHYGVTLQPGAVGENFTLRNIVEDQVFAGDIVRVGTALVQMSGPRIPCANLARRIGREDWVRLTLQENRTGFLPACAARRVRAPGRRLVPGRTRQRNEGSIDSGHQRLCVQELRSGHGAADGGNRRARALLEESVARKAGADCPLDRRDDEIARRRERFGRPKPVPPWRICK